MFVVGVVGAVGGVIAGAASHDDYSDWKDHHQYNDAGVLADIKSKRELRTHCMWGKTEAGRGVPRPGFLGL